MSKTVKIARTERVSLSKSPMFKTSVKKLGPLARQIAGKPIDEAILQMRFSKKKAAIDVKKHLEYARDNAIVRRGMGLGEVKVAEEGKEDEVVDNEKERKALVVEDKDGKRRIVTDRTSIYVDQAWVGRGSFTKSPEYRARGRVNMLMHPTTSEFSSPSPCFALVFVRFFVTFAHTAGRESRYLGRAQGRKNQDPARGRKRAKTPKEESLGAVTR